MNQYENQQKRIAFLALHRDLIGNASKNLDYKAEDELVKKVYDLVDALFDIYPMNGKDTKETVTKIDDLPL